jgi:5-(carboxyamino)imidazole ribonucleotide mutase
MMGDCFRNKVEAGLGCAVILAGSDSDESHIDKLANALGKYGIPFEARIASAHKQSGRLAEIIEKYDKLSGPLVYISVAGGTDALSGTVSYISTRPTISCPPDKELNQSCLTNPPGSSNAYIAKPENAARFIAQIFSSFNRDYRLAILRETEQKRDKLELADSNIRNKYCGDNGP